MSNRTPKLEDPEWGKQIAAGLGLLVLLCGAPLVFHPNTGDSAPSAELGHSPLDKLIRFGTDTWATICAWAPVALYVLAGVAGVTVVTLVAARQGRALLRAAVRKWWIYRRRWAHVLDKQGLLVKHGKKIKVPKLGKIRVLESMDVMQVRMPQGQDLDDWQEVAQPLALAFGASAGFVQPDNSSDKDPYQDIVVAFARGGGAAEPRMLLSARELAALPVVPGYTKRPVTIRVSARALILGWGSLQVDDGTTIRSIRLWGRRWNRCLIVPAT
ncbi:hypothetical protein ACWIGW_44390 [Nocardia brasiliensis]